MVRNLLLFSWLVLSTTAFGVSQPFAAEQETAQGRDTGTVYIVNQDLREFLREVGRRSGYEVSITRKVRGNVRQARLPLDMKKVMEELSAQHDLKWYFQQNQLFVSTGADNSTRLIYLGKMSNEDLLSALNTARLEASGFDKTYVEESNSVLVNGPASYIANVELLVEAFNKDAKNRSDGVRVIRFGRVGN